MINHTRTLLLNKPASFYNGGSANEYVPPDFTPVTLDTPLQRIYNTVIPRGLDPTGMNYVAAAVLKILECPELDTYAKMFDPRITYSDSGEILARLTDDPVAIESHLSAGCDIVPKYIVNGANQPSNINVAGSHVWTCTPVDSTNLRIVSSRGGERIMPVFNVSDPTRSLDIPVIADYLTLYFELPSSELTGSFNITYSATVAVPYNVAQRLTATRQLMIQPHILERVFQPAARYQTQLDALRDVWVHAHEAVLEFGAVVLAYLIQCEVTRLAVGGAR